MRNALRMTIVAGLLAAVPAVAAGATAGSQVRAITCFGEKYKPTRITLSCADAGTWLGKLKWTHWNGTTATATGAYNENTCTPTCSAGHNVSKPVEVTLSKPKTCPGQAHPGFGRATFSFPSGSPPSPYHHFTFTCPVLPGQY